MFYTKANLVGLANSGNGAGSKTRIEPRTSPPYSLGPRGSKPGSRKTSSQRVEGQSRKQNGFPVWQRPAFLALRSNHFTSVEGRRDLITKDLQKNLMLT